MSISIDDFAKVELKVGTILSGEIVEGSAKLLKFTVDLGNETRQILSGIAAYYQPEELVGRQVVVIANLEPRMIMGLESQGMLLAAGDGEKLSLLTVEKNIAPGSKIT